MPDILQGSLGIIERFFDSELAEENNRRPRGTAVITPERIIRLPKAQRQALASAFAEFNQGSAAKVDEFRRSLRSGEGAVRRPTMLIGRGFEPIHPVILDQSLHIVAYFRRVIVDDPIVNPVGVLDLFLGMRQENTRRDLERLAQLRPLIVGGYIGLFPPDLAEQFEYADPYIAKEATRRTMEHEEMRRERLTAEGMCGTSIRRYDEETGRRPYRDPVLDRLAASVGLGVDAMDTTGDEYVLKYLGKDLTANPTKLARFRLPRLELLPPRELAALLASNEVLAEVADALDSTLRHIPNGLCGDPELAARWIDERLADELEEALGRLRGTLRNIPDAAKVGGAGAAIGATVLAGVLTASPAAALAVGAAGAAADVTAAWLHQWRRREKNEPAMRVLTHLARMEPQLPKGGALIDEESMILFKLRELRGHLLTRSKLSDDRRIPASCRATLCGMPVARS